MTALITSSSRRLVAAGGSLVLAILLTVGVPLLLWRLAGWPLPGQVPSPDGIGRALSRSSVSDLVIIKALALVGWGAWLLLCWSLVVETWAWVRGRPAAHVRLAGPIQVLARQIVTTVSLLAVTGMSSPSPQPVMATSSRATLILESEPQPAPVAAIPAPSPATSTPAAPITYTVQRRDSLWRIAECQLGDPMRWREIWDLNSGREFDGVKFTNANLIYPGWVLMLPPGAQSAVPTPPTVPPPPTATRPEVEPPSTVLTAESTTTTAAPLTTTPNPPAPATSSAVTAPTDRTTSDESASADEGQSRAPLFTGGIALATALLLILSRMRRSQARRRLPGRAPYRPPAEMMATEVSLRRAADPPRMHRLTTALRAFACGLGDTLPELAAVRVTSDEVELLLGTPARATPPGFEDRGDQRAFATEPGITATTLEGLASDTTSPWPAIVAVGCLGDDLVLIDLETAGILTIDGIDAVDTVRRIAAELAASAMSDLIEIVIVGDEFDLATSDRVRAVPTIGDAIDTLKMSARSTRAALDELGDPNTPIARRDHSSEQGWGVTVLVSLSPLAEPERRRLADIAPPRCGVAAVVVGEALAVGWSLAAGQTAHLTPHGFDLDPLVLPEQHLAAVDELLSDAAVGDSEHELLTDTDPQVSGTEPEVYLPTVVGPTPPAPDVDVEVRVLGPVEVHGAPPINRRRTVELIAYLALHPKGVTASQLKTAIWPEAMPTQDTFNVTVHRARAGLGLDREGKHHLPHAVTSDVGYTVGPHVTTDLARFTDLVSRSRSAVDRNEECGLLRQALDLLRGQPFEGVRGYDWAFTEGVVVEAEATIADAAHRLARLALDRGDADLATWAAMQGLKSVPGSEPLYRDRMEAAHLIGDPAAVDRIVEELCRYIETLDPLDDLHPDTIELWHRIGRPLRKGRRESD
jgi:hypothetical protein